MKQFAQAAENEKDPLIKAAKLKFIEEMNAKVEHFTEHMGMYADPEQYLEDMLQEVSVAGASDWAAKVKAAPQKPPTKSCNVCRGACTKQCSLCRSVHYCSVECQRKDWKAHKKVCKGKQEEKKPAPPPVTTKKKPPPSTSRCHIEALPDELLARIGVFVGELCGVPDYVSLMKTSKRLHRVLTDKATQSILIEKENERILGQAFDPYAFDLTMIMEKRATNLVELHLYQTVAYLREGGFVNNNIYLKGTSADFEDLDYVNIALQSIAYVLVSNPSVTLLLDSHHTIAQSGAYETSRLIGMVVYNALSKGLKDVSWLKDRVRIRPWGSFVAHTCMQTQGSHARKLRENLGWVQVSFRIGDIGGFVLPRRPDFYPRTQPPLERLPLDGPNDYELFNDRALSKTMEERMVSMFKLTGLGEGTNVHLMVESLLVASRVIPEFMENYAVIYFQEVIEERRQTMVPASFVPEAASDDHRGILIEIITKAKVSGWEEARDPEEVLVSMEERFRRDGTLGSDQFLDRLMQRMINQRS